MLQSKASYRRERRDRRGKNRNVNVLIPNLGAKRFTAENAEVAEKRLNISVLVPNLGAKQSSAGVERLM